MPREPVGGGSGGGIPRLRASEGVRLDAEVVRADGAALRGHLSAHSRRSGRAFVALRGRGLAAVAPERPWGARAPVPDRGPLLLARRPVHHRTTADRVGARSPAAFDP